MSKLFNYFQWQSIWYTTKPDVFSLTTTSDNSFEEICKSEAFRDIYYTIKFYVSDEDAIKIKETINNFKPGMDEACNLLNHFQDLAEEYKIKKIIK